MNSKEILSHLRKSYKQPQWSFIEELRCGTGYNYNTPTNVEQRIDAFAVNCYPSKDYETIAFEVKVSRADFTREVKNPNKRQQAMCLSNRFYFVTPVGLVKADEIPEGCGLIEVHETGRRSFTKRAPKRQRLLEPSWSFAASIGRRLNKVEEQLRLTKLQLERSNSLVDGDKKQ